MHTLTGQWKSSGETRRIKKKKIQNTPTFRRLRSGSTNGNKLRVNPLPRAVKLGGNSLHTEPVLQLISQKDTEATWRHSSKVSPHTSHYTEAVFSMIREIYGRTLGDPVKDLDVNLATWRIFMNTTLRASVHLGKDYEANLRYVEHHLWKTAGQLFEGNKKVGQLSDRNRWHKRDQFPRFEAGIDKLIAQSSFSIFHC